MNAFSHQHNDHRSSMYHQHPRHQSLPNIDEQRNIDVTEQQQEYGSTGNVELNDESNTMIKVQNYPSNTAKLKPKLDFKVYVLTV